MQRFEKIAETSDRARIVNKARVQEARLPDSFTPRFGDTSRTFRKMNSEKSAVQLGFHPQISKGGAVKNVC